MTVHCSPTSAQWSGRPPWKGRATPSTQGRGGGWECERRIPGALGGSMGLRKGGRASSPSPHPGCCPHRSAWSRWPSSLGCPASWSARKPSRLWPKNSRSGRGVERGAGARASAGQFPPQGWDSHPLGPGARPCQEPHRFSGASEGFRSLKHFLSKSPAPLHHQAGDPQRGSWDARFLTA